MVKVAILGTGLIGTDLLIKVLRSKYLECAVFAGQREDSPGIIRAKELGIPTSTKSIDAIVELFQSGQACPIIFDATNASTHKTYASIFKSMGKFVIDLTPAKLGKVCVPSLNLKECLKEQEINLGSCTVQAVVPKIAKLKNLEYVEIVTTIASKSAGMGTRENLSEYLITTADVIKKLTGAKTKVILIINPAILTMHNTIYAKFKDKDELKIIQFKVEGAGDFLPKYAGNLDIMTNSAIKVAEAYVKNI